MILVVIPMGIMELSNPKVIPIDERFNLGSDLYSSYQWPYVNTLDLVSVDALLRVSKSSLGDFKWCAQQYFIKRILGVKEEETDAMTRGTNVHDCMEEFYNEFDVDAAIEAKKEGHGALVGFFQDLVPESTIKGEEFGLDEDEHLEKLINVEAARFMEAEPQHFLPVGNEIELHAIVEIEGIKVHLNGFIDRLFADDNGLLHVHELKTGKWKETKYKYEGMREELAFYAYLIKHCKDPVIGGKDVAFWGWDHTGGESIFRFFEPIRVREVASMLEALRNLVKAHKKYAGGHDGSAFPELPKYRIKRTCEPWCRVKGFCPHYDRVLMP